MSNSRQNLVDGVVRQIRKDVDTGDVTSVEQLINQLPYRTLLEYLPEDTWIEYPEE